MTTRLPVIGSTASSTAFVTERLDGLDGRHLWLDGNGKITAGNGTLEAPRPNAFSLLQIDDCPQSTPTCRASCYVHNLKKAQPELHAKYAHNSRTIREILAEGDPSRWTAHMGWWIAEHARGGFRWHVSGDLFSFEYARFVADVVLHSGAIRHWIYTRSFDLVGPLIGHPAIALNFSCDRDNYEYASTRLRSWQRAYGHRVGRLCYLVTEPDELIPELPEGSVIFPDYKIRPRQFSTLAESDWWQAFAPAQRQMVCPVDAHGKAENRRCGPCDRCMK